MQKYRSDIDGMRAIAVSTVVLGHAHMPGFSAGFLGVDIFFVISGFLITNILLKSDGTLGEDILKFYDRRIRRIAPALVLVLLACTVAAFVLFSPYELKEYARTLLAATGFASNLYFMAGTEYFAPRYETPLLHLWSLGVEEQFYIVYPIFLWFMTRRAKRYLIPVLIAVFVASLAFSEVLGERHTRDAFFFSGWRAWELVLGALVALRPLCAPLSRMMAESLAAIAMLMAVVPVALFTPETSWPGIHALIPCAGAALLLWLHEGQRTFVSRLLSVKPMVGIGLISYSLYLWHWPLFEFYHRLALRMPTTGEYEVLIGLAILAAWVSWRFVERPFRRTQNAIPARTMFTAAAVSAVMLVAISGAVFAGDGFPQRFTPAVARVYATLDMRDDPAYIQANQVDGCAMLTHGTRYAFAKCFVLAPDRVNVLLWGDSLARNLFAGLHTQADANRINLVQATHSSCPPVVKPKSAQGSCIAFNRSILDHVNAQFDTVIIVGHVFENPKLIAAMQDTAVRIVAKGSRVIVIGPPPESEDPVPFYVARYTATGDSHALALANASQPDIEALDTKMQAAFSGMKNVTYVSYLRAVCGANICPAIVDGAPAEFDKMHLTLAASNAFVAKLWPQIHAAIGK